MKKIVLKPIREICKSPCLKILRSLSLSFIVLFMTVFNVIADDSIEQQTGITINVVNKSVLDVLKLCEEQSHFSFFYNEGLIDVKRKISIKEENVKLETILQKIFKGTKVKFAIKGNQIILTNQNLDFESGLNSHKDVEKSISGIVTDEGGMPLPGVSVFAKGTSVGVITGINGDYLIEMPSNSDILVFSFIGMKRDEVKIEGQTAIDIVMKQEAIGLNEVIAVGYGVQKKVNLTGSIEVVGSEKLQSRPLPNASQMLQGQVSGITFQTGNLGYEPGASMDIKVRGAGSLNGGSAYVLVDGVPGELDGLNPNDIENISVLKDAASSAIYGARAPYGVILVTTKKGKRDEKFTVSINSNISFSEATELPEMVDSYTLALAMNEAGNNKGKAPFSDETVDRIRAFQAGNITDETIADSKGVYWMEQNQGNGNNDWFDIFYGTAVRHQENVTIKGGSKKSSYYLSAGYVSDEGILKFAKDNFKRYNITARFDTDLKDWLNFGYKTRYKKSLRTKPNFDNQGGYDLMFHQIARTLPTQPLKTPNGYYTKMSKIPYIQDAGYDEIEGHTLYNTFDVKITPLSGWTINADFTYKLFAGHTANNNFIAYQDLVDGSMVALPTTVPSNVSRTQQNNLYYTTNIYTTYQFKAGKDHNFKLMAGFQQEERKNRSLRGLQFDLITENVSSIATATGDQQVFENLAQLSTQGYFSRFNYNYKEKYLIEANCRYDGTSKFTDGNRWGFFPSFSLGWNIAREDFWGSISSKIQTFKLRGSWGQLGNQNVSSYQDLALLGVKNNLTWLIDGERPVYVTSPNLTAPGLTWETAETTDLGFDLGAFDNKLNLTFDWYERLTKDMLGPAQVLPALIGANLPRENNGTLRTRGWEVLLSYKNRISKDFSFYVTATLSDHKQKVIKYNNPTGILTNHYEGKVLGEIWGYESSGLIQDGQEDKTGYVNEEGNVISQTDIFGQWQTGDVMYNDLDGDGKITNGDNTIQNSGDRRIIGNSTPRYQYGLTLGGKLKNWDFSVFFQGVAKRDVFLGKNMFWGFRKWNQTTVFKEHLNYYRDVEASEYAGLGVNTDAYFPRPYLDEKTNNKNRLTQTRYLQNGAYLRMKNIQIGYNLPKEWLSKINLKDVRVYFSGENLLTFSSLPKAFDPETVVLNERFGDGKSHLPQKSYSFGLDIKF